MTNKKMDISQLSEYPRRYMVAKILEKRDDVAKYAKRDMVYSLSAWRSIVPYKTGTMRSLMMVRSDKYSSALVPRSNYIMVANSVNKRGKHKGFMDKFKRNQGKSFLSKW